MLLALSTYTQQILIQSVCIKSNQFKLVHQTGQAKPYTYPTYSLQSLYMNQLPGFRCKSKFMIAVTVNKVKVKVSSGGLWTKCRVNISLTHILYHTTLHPFSEPTCCCRTLVGYHHPASCSQY